MSAGIDKLWLTAATGNFQIHSQGPGMIGSLREDVEAKDPFRVTLSNGKITPYSSLSYHGEGIDIRVDQRGLKIDFNPSKLLNGDQSFDLVGVDRVADTLEIIQPIVRKFIEVDLIECGVARIDLAKNKKMKYPVQDYSAAFKAVRMKYGKDTAIHNAETFSFRNKSNEITFYDKGLERGLDIGDLMRGEIRAKKRDSVSRLIGVKNVDQLLRSNQKVVDERYGNYLMKSLFNSYQKIGEQMKINFDSYREQISFYSQYEKGDPLILFGIEKIKELVSVLGVDDFVVWFLEAQGKTLKRYEVSRTRKKINNLLSWESSFKSNEVLVKDLINEITDKFVYEGV